MPLDDQKERNRAIENAVVQIEKQFGKGSIMRRPARRGRRWNRSQPARSALITRSGSASPAPALSRFSAGLGQTTIAMQVIAEAQKRGEPVGTRARPDAEYAQKLASARESPGIAADNGESARNRRCIILRTARRGRVDSVAGGYRSGIEGERARRRWASRPALSQACANDRAVSKSNTPYLITAPRKIGVCRQSRNDNRRSGAGSSMPRSASNRVCEHQDGDQVIGEYRVQGRHEQGGAAVQRADSSEYGEESQRSDLLDLREKTDREESGAGRPR